MNKRGADVWISYVLLVGFTVALAAFIYSWMTGFSIEKTTEIKERIYDADICGSVAISINACNSSQTLYINITNRGDIRINQLIFRLDNGTDYTSFEINTTIKPQNSETFNFTNVKIINATPDVVPATFKDKYDVVCTDKKAMSAVANC